MAAAVCLCVCVSVGVEEETASDFIYERPVKPRYFALNNH